MSETLTTPQLQEESSSLSSKDWLLALMIGLSIGGLLCYAFFVIVIPPIVSKASADTSAPATIDASAYEPPVLESTIPKVATEVPLDLSPVYEKLLLIPNLIHALATPSQDMIPHHFQPISLRVTFYTGLARENGGYEEMNALGYHLKIGSLAAPKDIPFGTAFIIEGLPKDVGTDVFIVDDRGGAITRIDANTIKVDVYVKRLPSETDTDYYKRVNDLGVIYTVAKYKLPDSYLSH